MPSNGNASVPSWRIPSEENQKKYHLVPLPEQFEPTEEENQLVQMYETIKSFERQAARLKDQRMRDKMAAKQSEFNEKNQLNKRKRRRKKRPVSKEEIGSADDDENSVEYSDNESSEDEPTLEERRAEKLDALRDEVDKAKKAMVAEETKEENLRQNLLAKNDDTTLGPSPLKRRVLQDSSSDGGLISNMKVDTPVHEFSEKLDIKPGKGNTLFPSV